ncbi:DUF6712 family protein [Flavobacterium sp. 3HN19-14]|uniref:DUF6712 family protein n=1 Tax=Flavobacterium sp. 3HN19-14 TaxID=3448133 RepID=UPI003EE2D79C
MIIDSVEDLKKYVPVAENFTFETFEPYIEKAVNAYTSKYVGNLHKFLKLPSEADAENAEVKNEARKHLASAIANFGYFLFTPFNSITMDASGMQNIESASRKRIENWQLNDIRRELLRSGHESMAAFAQGFGNNAGCIS